VRDADFLSQSGRASPYPRNLALVAAVPVHQSAVIAQTGRVQRQWPLSGNVSYTEA